MLVHSEDSASKIFFAALERRLSKQAFETWFRPLRISRSQSDGVFRIAVPNPAVRDWILAQYSKVLTESLHEMKIEGFRIEWAMAQGEPAGGARDLSAASDISVLPLGQQPDDTGLEPVEATQLPEIPSAPLNLKYTFSSFVVA